MIKKQTINPFIVTGKLQFRRTVTEIITSGTPNDSYTPTGTVTKSHYLIDAHNKVNLFIPSVGDLDELIFTDMSSKARDLVLYVMIHLRNNQDFIQLPYNKLIKALKLSRRTISEALKELVRNNIITIKSQSVYWVNPYYIFNGNRFKYYSAIDPNIIQEV